jgi:hypothetical protein
MQEACARKQHCKHRGMCAIELLCSTHAIGALERSVRCNSAVAGTDYYMAPEVTLRLSASHLESQHGRDQTLN